MRKLCQRHLMCAESLTGEHHVDLFASVLVLTILAYVLSRKELSSTG